MLIVTYLELKIADKLKQVLDLENKYNSYDIKSLFTNTSLILNEVCMRSNNGLLFIS